MVIRALFALANDDKPRPHRYFVPHFSC